MNFSSVPENEWVISVSDQERISRLDASPAANELISQVAAQAMQAATAGGICLCWEEAIEKPSYWRANVKISIKEDLFDQLFNGRCGYRAQYYLSACEGENFNRTLIHALMSAIKTAYETKPLKNAAWSVIEASINGQYSKIGVKNNGDYEERNALITPRWKDYNFGSRVLKTFPPLVDVLGTFIKPNNFSDDWIDDCKKDRPHDMHKQGFS